ncbi:hypothetical protein ACHAXT_010871 [Thalassiosira profunda]
MTTRRPAASSILLPGVLALLCIAAVVLRGTRPSASNSADEITATRQPKEFVPRNASPHKLMSSPHAEGLEAKSRNMVGGYSDVDAELLRSEEVSAMATFAVSERAARAEEFAADAFLAVTPDEVESGAVQMKVLEAQRQVVAGLNYKLTIALFRGDTCMGAFKVTVYKPLPHTGLGPSVTSWGKALRCDEITELVAGEKEMEEAKANTVEERMEEEREEVEPDA